MDNESRILDDVLGGCAVGDLSLSLTIFHLPSLSAISICHISQHISHLNVSSNSAGLSKIYLYQWLRSTDPDQPGACGKDQIYQDTHTIVPKSRFKNCAQIRPAGTGTTPIYEAEINLQGPLPRSWIYGHIWYLSRLSWIFQVQLQIHDGRLPLQSDV